MKVTESESSAAVTDVAKRLVEQIGTLVEAALMHTELELPDLQGRLLSAGEDPSLVIAGLAEIMALGLLDEGSELTIELAVRARLIAERIAAGGIGLDSLLELAQAIQREAEILLLEGARTSKVAVATVRRLNSVAAALTLTVTRAYVETTFEDYLEQERALRALITIARAVARSLEPAEVAEAGLGETVGATHLDAGAVWLTSGAKRGLVLQSTVGLSPEEIEKLQGIDIAGHPEIATAIRSGVPVQMSLDNQTPLLSAYRNALVAPLSGRGGLVGMLILGSRQSRLFSRDEVIFVGAVADHMATALEHALEHRLEAHTDYLTGLANRAEFESTVRRELASAHRSRRPVTLVLMDLDRLKHINDSFGHHAGDEAIRAIGRVLKHVVRTSDISARLGGDEFGIAMPEAGLAQAEEVVARIRKALLSLGTHGGPPAKVELSYGIAQWEPGQDFLRLYKAADARLYADKRSKQQRASKIETSEARRGPSSSPRASSHETPSR